VTVTLTPAAAGDVTVAGTFPLNGGPSAFPICLPSSAAPIFWPPKRRRLFSPSITRAAKWCAAPGRRRCRGTKPTHHAVSTDAAAWAGRGWTCVLDGSTHVVGKKKVVEGIARSSEFLSKRPDNRDFVKSLYRFLLNRARMPEEKIIGWDAQQWLFKNLCSSGFLIALSTRPRRCLSVNQTRLLPGSSPRKGGVRRGAPPLREGHIR